MDFFKWGALSGIIEVGITHPIDVLKTRSHVKGCNRPFLPYAGVLPRLAGVVPMRCVFWGTMLGAEKKLGILQSSAVAGFAQTMIDVPIENMKIRKIMGTHRPIYSGFFANCGRNIGFAMCIGASIHIPAPYGVFLGTTAGVLLTQPLDVLKTAAQTGLPRQSLLSGMWPRYTQAMAAMVIGRTIIKIMESS